MCSPDDPAFRPVFDNIAAHRKTLVAHVAEPDSCWKPLGPGEPRLQLLQGDIPKNTRIRHKEWPSKEAILAARDHLLELHPNLKVVGAHLGSMEVGCRSDRAAIRQKPELCRGYRGPCQLPHAAVAGEGSRVSHQSIRTGVVYGTDNVLYPPDNSEAVLKDWGRQIRARLEILLKVTQTSRVRGGHDERLSPAHPVPSQAGIDDNAVRW